MRNLADGQQNQPSSAGSVTTIGAVARAALVESAQGKVMGVISQGLFLAFPSGPVMFLSFERFRGPLTINIHAGAAIPAGLKTGDPVFVRHQALHFPSTGSLLSLQPAAIWRAASTEPAQLKRSGLAQRMEGLVKRTLSLAGEGERPSLLSEVEDLLFGGQAEGLKVQPETDLLRHDLVRLQTSLERFLTPGAEAPSQGGRAAAGLAAAADAFLGRGAGLTPSGDDLVLGLVLALSRWETLFWPALPHPFRSSGLGSPLTAAAARKTTLLSSCLIGCACQGQADERLVSALDGLMTGAPGLEACAENLLSWGSSSGRDALAGMVLAVHTGLQGQAARAAAGEGES